MKIRLEFELDTDIVSTPYGHTTRTWVDGAEVTSRTTNVVFEHKAGDFPKFTLDLLKHKDGVPYVNRDKTDAARQIVHYDRALRITDRD